MSPTKIVVGVARSVISTFTVQLDNNCADPVVEVNLANAQGTGVHLSMTQTADHGNGHLTFKGTRAWNATSMRNAAFAGSWFSYIDASSNNGPFMEGYGSTFRVLRATSLTTDATPEPARKGSAITVIGMLKRADWDARTNPGIGGQRISLQFGTATSPYRTISFATSSSNGLIRTTVTARQNGCYRYVFAGTSTTANRTSAADCVALS